jgi:hypothetical protein
MDKSICSLTLKVNFKRNFQEEIQEQKITDVFMGRG